MLRQPGQGQADLDPHQVAVAVANSVLVEPGLTIPSIVYALAPAKGRFASLYESHNSYHAPYVSFSRLAHSPNSTSAPPLSSGILPILDHCSENPFAFNTPCDTGLSLATFCTHQSKHYIPIRTQNGRTAVITSTPIHPAHWTKNPIIPFPNPLPQ